MQKYHPSRSGSWVTWYPDRKCFLSGCIGGNEWFK